MSHLFTSGCPFSSDISIQLALGGTDTYKRETTGPDEWQDGNTTGGIRANPQATARTYSLTIGSF